MLRAIANTWASVALALSAVPFVATTSLQAAEPASSAATGSTESAATAEEIAQWVKDLDADQFVTREQASTRLASAGQDAIAPLAKVAESGSLEAGMRAVRLLSNYCKSSDAALSSAANAALEKVAKNANDTVAAAAKATLATKDANDADNDVGAMELPNGAIQIIGGGGFGGQIQIQVGNQMAQVARKIRVQEDGRDIEISVDQQTGIKMSVTEKVDGKEKTTKYEAKNSDELKQKHPEAHKIFDRHMGKANNPQAGGVVGRQGILIQAQPLPAAVTPEVEKNLGIRRRGAEAGDLPKTLTQLEAASEALRKQVAEGKIDADAAKPSLEAMDSAIKLLKAYGGRVDVDRQEAQPVARPAAQSR